MQDSLEYLPRSSSVATKLPVDLEWTPANIGIVNSVVMEEQDSIVLGDALRNISGINPQPASGVFDFFILRGFDSLSSSLILIDGAPEPESTFYQLYNVEGVEVFKGPAGFLYGSNPLAGVVNLVRKKPVPFRAGSVEIAGGSFGTTEAQFDFNNSSDDGVTSFRINGLWRESDGYRDGREQSVTAINPTFSWRPDDRSSLTLDLEFLASDYIPDAGLPIFNGEVADVPDTRSYSVPQDDSQQDVLRGQVDYERRIGDHLSLRDKLYFRELDWDTSGTILSGVADFGFGPQVFRTQTELDDVQSFLGNQLELVYDSERHQLLAGLEIGRYTDDFTLDVGLLPFIDLFNPVEAETVRPIPIPDLGSRGDSETTVIAPYLIDQIRVSDRVQVLVGVRFDSVDFDDEITGTSRSDSEVSPMAGIVVALSDNTTVYANAGQSFAPPSTRVIGERKPEESQQVELGLRQTYAGGRLHSTFAAYQLERENIAIPDDNGFTQQAGDQESTGLEIEFGGDFGNNISGTFSYAYTDAELTRFSELVQVQVPPFFFVFDRSGNQPAFAPENLFNGWLSKSFSNGLVVGGGVRYVDNQFIAEDNATELDAYTLVDASISYPVDRWKFSLHLKNLGDEEYNTRGFGAFSAIPGQPLSASLRIGYRM